MAVLAGAILHDINGFVIDRIQTAGPGNLNINEEKIYELGNWQSIATVRDTPDLTFDLESFDTSTELEAILVGKSGAANPGIAGTGDQLSGSTGDNSVDFQDAVPIDVISPFKSKRNQYNIIKGLVLPSLTLERATYRFGVGQNATQQFSLRGDTIVYAQGQPYFIEMENTGDGVYSLPVTPAIPYEDSNNTLYAYSVCLVDKATGAYKRLYYDDSVGATDGYSNTSTTFTINGDFSPSSGLETTYDTVRVTWASSTKTDYTQTGNNPNGNPVHENVSVKPAAVRAKDIQVYVGSTAATPVFTRMTSVQSVEATWSVSIENDEELGNSRYVSSEYDVPEVSGTITVKPFDTADLWSKLSMITGVPDNESIGPNSSVPIPLEIRINHPDGGRMKTIYIPDARFTPPGLSGQVQNKLEVQLAFSSDGGNMTVYNGSRV